MQLHLMVRPELSDASTSAQSDDSRQVLLAAGTLPSFQHLSSPEIDCIDGIWSGTCAKSANRLHQCDETCPRHHYHHPLPLSSGQLPSDRLTALHSLRGSFLRLKPRQCDNHSWLNDHVVNDFFALLNFRQLALQSNPEIPKTRFASTYFYTYLAQ